VTLSTTHTFASQVDNYMHTSSLMTCLYRGSNCPGISGTVPDFLPLSWIPEGLIVCPGSKLVSCTMSRFYYRWLEWTIPRVELLARSSHLLIIQSVTAYGWTYP